MLTFWITCRPPINDWTIFYRKDFEQPVLKLTVAAIQTHSPILAHAIASNRTNVIQTTNVVKLAVAMIRTRNPILTRAIATARM